jgi:hypothetical protein
LAALKSQSKRTINLAISTTGTIKESAGPEVFSEQRPKGDLIRGTHSHQGVFNKGAIMGSWMERGAEIGAFRRKAPAIALLNRFRLRATLCY